MTGRNYKDTIATYLTSDPKLTLSLKEYKEYIKKNKAPVLNFRKSLVKFANKELIEKTFEAALVPLCLDCYDLPPGNAKEIVKTLDFTQWENRIKIPIRGAECRHLDVLDLDKDIGYIITNKKCRLCENNINLLSIYIDTTILGILNSNDNAPVASFPTGKIELEMIKAMGKQELTDIAIEVEKRAKPLATGMVYKDSKDFE